MHAIITVCLTAVTIVACLALYLLPTLIAVVRRTPGTTTVVVLNILLGWTLVGWLASAALAIRKPAPSIQV